LIDGCLEILKIGLIPVGRCWSIHDVMGLFKYLKVYSKGFMASILRHIAV
jgi:hypothetical protein